MDLQKPQFRVYTGDGPYQLDEKASVEMTGKMFSKSEKDSIGPVYSCRVDVPSQQRKTDMVFISSIHPEEEHYSVPGWLRKEKKRCKRDWHLIGEVLKRPIKWLPPFFEELPVVEQAKRKYT